MSFNKQSSPMASQRKYNTIQLNIYIELKQKHSSGDGVKV